jgi:phage terminase large subunit-like protein
VREQFPTRGDKAVRAQSIRARIAMQGLRILKSAPWKTDLMNEMVSFPVGKHDDMVDALGLVGQLLDKMLPGLTPEGTPAPRVRDYGDRDDDQDDNWKVV